MKATKQILALWLAVLGFLVSCAHPAETSNKSENDFSPMLSIVKFYQGPLNHLSAVKQSECPMNPSCSEYSVACIRKHGFFVGWIMTCDRLMRCGRDEVTLSPLIFVHGKWKHYDPVEANDWWWNGK